MFKYLFFSLFILISFSCSKDTTHRIASIPEASGIDYCKESDLLVVANDEGSYYLISREGEILKKKKLGKYDLEAVVCTKKHFIFAIEDKGLLYVDRKSGKKKKREVDTNYHNDTLLLFDKKEGVEGIAKEGDTLYLAKQAKKKRNSFIVAIHYDRYHQKIKDLIKAKIPDTAGLTLYKGSLFMVSDKKDLLVEYDIKRKKILQKIKLPKASQEGITFDGMGYLYIADDDGYVLKFSEKELGLK